jgi:ADP-L-glycero-D-manno-heptose 6-epimerase
MKDKKNNILITGGAGFIGSNLALEIQENYCNSNIIVIDDFSLGTKDNLKNQWKNI